MLKPAEARQTILDTIPRFDTESVSYTDVNGRVLHQKVVAERDQPPFDRVTMDGIAIAHASFADGAREFAISGTEHAGDPMLPLDDASCCIEVMTGAVLPAGSDTVIPVERITVADSVASIDEDYAPAAGQFVHRQGSDHRAGIEVLSPGIEITPTETAIIASCGLADVDVAARPIVRVISTGNELVAPGQPVAPHQIRLSNGPALVAMLRQHGFSDCEHDHLIDDPAVLRQQIGRHLDDADVLVLSGGVSMGKADFVPQILNDLGVGVVFHRISQRPGKPMWFGNGPNNQAVFALPGNPVSSLVCCRQYVLPAMYAASGRRPAESRHAILADDVEFKPALTYFLPVRIHVDDNGTMAARPVPTNTSGDFTALGGTDGYVELDADETRFAAGRSVPYHAWNAP